MGEMADFLLEQTLDAYPDWSPVGSGRHGNVGPKQFVTCRDCDAKRLSWAWLDNRWCLVSGKGNKRHHCKPEVLHAKHAADFTDLDEQTNG